MATFAWTYATLKTAIADFVEDDSTEFSNALDNIIGLSELRIYREADLDAFRKTSTFSHAQSDQYLGKPSDFVIDRFMYITVSGTYVYLDQKSVSWCLDYWPTAASEDQPVYYADWDHDTFLIVPTPDAAYTFTLGYTYRPDRLDSTTTTSWLGTNAPDALLYACLCEAGGYLQELNSGEEPGMLQVWEQKYQQALLRLVNEEESRQRRTEGRYGERRG